MYLECLAALVRPHLTFSETHPATSYPGTCLWLYDSPDFQAWHHRSDTNKNRILWIRGESGCGKTILLRSLRRRLERQWAPAGSSFIWSTAEGHDTNTIFFPGARRQQHEINPANVYRSLLAQLFLQDATLRKTLLALYNLPRDKPETFDDALVVSFFADNYINHRIETPTRRSFIFVDISDDASPAYVEELICRLSKLARNSDFSICVASAHHPTLEENRATSIVMHLRNSDDILRYVNLNLVAEWEERNQTVVRIGHKAGGVFLWAEIVVNILNAAITEGASQDLIEYTLEEVPGDLHGLYEWMLATLNEREKAESLILFQWVILAAEPMRLNDLFVAVRLTDPEPFAAFEDLGPFMALTVGLPISMRELRQLRNSEITSDTPYQFHRWLRARSIGLLELKTDSRRGVANEPWGLQKVQPIHSSVRSFFLSGQGFACLSEGLVSPGLELLPEDFIDLSHYSLLRACLTYLNMRDFENLGQTRTPTTTTTTQASSPITPATTTTLSSLSTLINSPGQVQPTPQELHFRQKTILSQRTLVMSSYPFLQYAVDNLLFHLLSPRYFRYFLPQHELFLSLSANRFRLWRRWTSLLGTADTIQIFQRHTGAAAALLSPVFGARFRVERVFRKLGRVSVAVGGGNHAVVVGSPGGNMGLAFLSPVTSTPGSTGTPKTPRSGKTTGVGGGGFFDQGWNGTAAAATIGSSGSGNTKTAAAAAGFWTPTITSHFRIPPTISLPVPPRVKGKEKEKGKGGMGKSPVKRRPMEVGGGDMDLPGMGMGGLGLEFVDGGRSMPGSSSDGRPSSPVLPDYEGFNGVGMGMGMRGEDLKMGLDSMYENGGFGLGIAM